STMPRACVIVLDAVGAGELPDAADYGDVGSNTLANVAQAVGGLDLPNLEALGLGNVEELEGKGHDGGALGADGRRHADALPDVPVRVPRPGDRPVHEPHGPRGDRQQ